MRQKELINLLDTVMPEIAETGNPEAVLIKCAKANNLSPAQLEKFGHVFNAMKSNVFFKKASNRGGSFSIVNVPEMVSKYTTWTPNGKAPSKKATIEKSASTAGFDIPELETGKGLPTPDQWFSRNVGADGHLKEDEQFNFEDFTDRSEWETLSLADYVPSYDVMHKAASNNNEEAYKVAMAKFVATEENVKQAAFEAREEITEAHEELRQHFLRTPENWPEAAFDMSLHFGEKTASVIEGVEKYFASHFLKAPKFTMDKEAAADTPFLQDRHGVYDIFEHIIACENIEKRAHDLLEKMAASPNPKNTQSLPSSATPEPSIDVDMSDSDSAVTGSAAAQAAVNPIRSLLAGMKSPYLKPGDDSILKPLSDNAVKLRDALDGAGPFAKHDGQDKIDRAMLKAKKDTTLQQLMLSDDIIANADPQVVQDLFDTIASASPTFASNPHLMGPALKEAIQYNSLPVQTFKDILEAEKLKAEIKEKTLRAKAMED